jgi:hypothetical protein
MHHGFLRAGIEVAGFPGYILLAAVAVLRGVGFLVKSCPFQELLAPCFGFPLRWGFLHGLRDDFVDKCDVIPCTFGDAFTGNLVGEFGCGHPRVPPACTNMQLTFGNLHPSTAMHLYSTGTPYSPPVSVQSGQNSSLRHM